MRVLTLLLTTLFVCTGASVAHYEPYWGFVTVPGQLRTDDLGPDPRILGNAIAHSDATCVRASTYEVEHIPLNGRVGIGYVGGGVSESILQTYNDAGYFYFIFENEPDGTAAANPNWAEDYMRRLNATYPRIKAFNPQNQVIGGHLLSFNFDKLYELGFKESSDMIGFHNYSNDPANGINMEAIPPVYQQMLDAGDGDKQIFLGEGWGPTRELPGLQRLFPDAEIPAAEIQMLRDFVVNGYWTTVTSTEEYDPKWIWGVLFFTLNDNWGGQGWAPRAQPAYDEDGNVTTYFVDGYDVGLDIWPHFYNGGLIDIMGNAKDNLMDIFPGTGLAISNSGFEYYEPTNPAVAADWTRIEGDEFIFNVDSSVRRGGLRSQRITLGDTGGGAISQDSVRASIRPGNYYRASVWVRTYRVDGVPGSGAAISIQYLNADGQVTSRTATSETITGTNGWTRLTVGAGAPAGADRIRVILRARGDSGMIWFDDAIAWRGSLNDLSAIEGYVLDEERRIVEGAVVRTTTGDCSGTTNSDGFFRIENVTPGVYNVKASAEGYSTRTALAQLALPGKTRPMGFTLPRMTPSHPTGVRVQDPAVGGVLKVSFEVPDGPYDYIRIYRTDQPVGLGELVHDQVITSPVWDTGLVDGTQYSYTVRAVLNGIESDNNDHYYGIPSAGTMVTPYSGYPAAQWGHFGSSFGQSFTANATGSIASASAMPGFGPGPSGTDLTFTIHEDGPGGAQIGPSRTAGGAGNAETTVTWSQGEVPVEEGKVYYLRVSGARDFAAYRGNKIYDGGHFFIDDEPEPDSDMWSTIKIVTPRSVRITDVNALYFTPDAASVTWKTNAPATSQVIFWEYPNGQEVTVTSDDLPTTRHRVVLTGLREGQEYRFRVVSTRDDIPDAESLVYPFTMGN